MVPKRHQQALLAVLAASALAFPATAGLVSIDLVTPGDGLITRDTESGLDWLELGYTGLLSISDFNAGNCGAVPECPAGGWPEDGWQMANTSEVCNLFHEFDLDSDTSCPDPVEQGFYPDDGYQKLGVNFYNGLGEPTGISGVFDDGPPASTGGSAWMVNADNPIHIGLQIIIEDAVSSNTPALALFVVRPSPSPPPPPPPPLLVPGLLPKSAIFMAALIAIAGRALYRQRPSRGRAR